MNMMNSVVILSGILAFVYARSAKTQCKTMEYYDRETETCKSCRIDCPPNLIIVKPCGWYSDTTCGNLPLDFTFNLNTEGTVDNGNGGVSQPTSLVHTEIEETFDGNRWFTIAMVLSGVICVMCLCISAYAIVACICKDMKKNKEIIYNPVYIQRDTDEEPRYVEIFRPASRNKKSRVMNNGRISTFQSTSALPLLQPQNSENIYINCMEYLPIGSLQTNSSDYVYLESN